jgi:hypothetical protein
VTRKKRSRKKVKAPPQDTDRIYDPEKFQEFIEILETCQSFISSSSQVKIRLSLILLDNLAEVLMYYKGNELIEDDKFSKKFIAAKYSPSDCERFNKDFAGKVWFLSEKTNLFTIDDATILRIGHAYRNAAFHRDEHNPQATAVIVVLVFAVACRLLAIAYGDNKMVGGDMLPERWLKSYGINKPFLEFGPVSRHIGSQLLNPISVSQEDVTVALMQDLKVRWQLIVGHVTQELPLPELVLDEILKTEDFDDQFDDNTAQEPILEANRIIAQGSPFSRDEYRRREREYFDAVRTAYMSFSPTLQWNDVKTMKETFIRLERQKTPGCVLTVYEELSDRLAKAEHLLTSAIRKNEAAGELASDIARGK